MGTHALGVLLGFLSPVTPHCRGGVGGEELLDSDSVPSVSSGF